MTEKDRLIQEYYEAKVSGQGIVAQQKISLLSLLDIAVSSNDNTELTQANTISVPMAVASGGSGGVSMTWVRQTNGYYCGPATVLMMITRRGKTGYTQGSLASMLGTTTQGTNWCNGPGTSVDQYPVAKTLNDIWIGKTYIPKSFPGIGSVLDEYSIRTSTVAAIDASHTNAYHGVSTYGYNSYMTGYPTDYPVGHWLTVDAYSNNGSTLEVVDPASGLSGFGTVNQKYNITSTKMYYFCGGIGMIY